MASNGIILARAAMAFSIAVFSVPLNVIMAILAINLTYCYVACPSKRNLDRAAAFYCPPLNRLLNIIGDILIFIISL